MSELFSVPPAVSFFSAATTHAP